jgi:cytochrome c oxidase subunit IV
MNATAVTESPATDPHAHVGHVVPVALLAGVLAILLVLTVVTVAATWIDLGSLGVWVALAIATVKATLVALYFMHLRYDRPFNGLILIGALLFVMLFVSLALMDTHEYQATLDQGPAPAVPAAKAAQ